MGLVENFGLTLNRMNVSHPVFHHPDLPEMLNLQEMDGEAKPYQIRQFLLLIERYNLMVEDSDE